MLLRKNCRKNKKSKHAGAKMKEICLLPAFPYRSVNCVRDTGYDKIGYKKLPMR